MPTASEKSFAHRGESLVETKISPNSACIWLKHRRKTTPKPRRNDMGELPHLHKVEDAKGKQDAEHTKHAKGAKVIEDPKEVKGAFESIQKLLNEVDSSQLSLLMLSAGLPSP